MKEYSFYMGNHNAYSVTPISERVVRIRYNATGVFKETLMERYDIIEHPSIEVESSFADAEGEKSIIMRDVEVRFSEDASFSLEYRKNKVISRVIPFHPQEDVGVGGKITVRDNERFYGCGYRPQKGIELRGSIIKNWCAPVTNNGPSPFFISSGGWGLFFNNTRETFFDFAKRESDKLVFWSADGEFDIYSDINSRISHVQRILTMIRILAVVEGVCVVMELLAGFVGHVEAARSIAGLLACFEVLLLMGWKKIKAVYDGLVRERAIRE